MLVAGQCSEQRPHSTQVKACSEINSVMSLPVSRPKSSSPESGGILLKVSRFKKTVTGLSSRCRCLVWGTKGRNTRIVSVCAHHSRRLDSQPGTKVPRYVIISKKISSAMMPDSGDNGPSHFGRITNRRKDNPAMETATATAKTAAMSK